MGKGLKKWIEQTAENAGYSVLATWRREHHAAARHLQALFEFLSVDCVLDVGANEGQFRDFVRDQVGYDGAIVSFEPIPSYADVMQARASNDPKWLIENFALGSEQGPREFNVMVGSQFSSFLDPDHSEVQSFNQRNRVIERILVPIRTLDDVMPSILQRTQARSIYLKMDTQGFDLEVLKGARQSLPKICALQSEASVKPIYANMPDYATTIETIHGLDFELSGIFPNNSGHFPLLIEFDCVFIASRFSGK